MAAPQPGSYGNIRFSAEVLSNRFIVRNNYSIIPKTSGFPTVQKHGDPLIKVSLGLRFDVTYNASPNTPMAILDRFLSQEVLGNDENGYELRFANKVWGNFVVDNIEFTFVQMVDSGEPEIIDVDLILLQVN